LKGFGARPVDGKRPDPDASLARRIAIFRVFQAEGFRKRFHGQFRAHPQEKSHCFSLSY